VAPGEQGAKLHCVPIITLIVVALSVLVHALPSTTLLAYNRQAILAGEWWRLATGHWVHFSAQHFLYDTAAFGILGWMIETRGEKNFAALCLISVFTISVSMLLFEPRLQICGGLSGLATATLVFLALNGLGEKGPWQWLCGTALIICVVKLSFELLTGKFLVLHTPASFSPAPSNHIAGALTAVVVYMWPRLRPRFTLQPRFTG
jgi:rhomboid family GlyGly-CTERM serine protease